MNLLDFDPEGLRVTKCVCEEGNTSLAGVGEWINKIKQSGARTLISDGPGRDRMGSACCFPLSTGVMFSGFMCCKVRVVLAHRSMPAPVLRLSPILPEHGGPQSQGKERKC